MSQYAADRGGGSAVIAAVGDFFVRREKPTSTFDGVRNALGVADVRFGNCEGIYSNTIERDPQAAAYLIAPPTNVDALTSVGFDVVCLANNKTLHCGYTGLADTLAEFKRRGILTVGAGENDAVARRPAIVRRNGLQIGFLAFTCTYPPGVAAGPSKPGAAVVEIHTIYKPFLTSPGTISKIITLADPGSKARLIADVSALREQVDVVVVSMHWGISNVPAVLADYETELGQAAIDAGADLIIGGGQHLPKGVQLYRNAVIVHGLGGIVFDAPSTYFHPDHVRTYVAHCRVSKHRVDEFALVPARVPAEGDPVASLPASAQFADDLEYLRRVSNEAGLTTRYEAEGARIRICF